MKTDELKKIDLARLRQLGLLKVGRRVKLTWSRGGEPVGHIDVEIHERSFLLDYRVREYGGEWESIRETVPLTFTDQHLGGKRVWFECVGCWRRCRVLYGGRLFRCRKCHRLTYASQYEDAANRIISRAQRNRVKLGGDGGMGEFFPQKPKWMRWKTYRRLEQQDEEAYAIFAAILLGYEMRGFL